MNDVDKMFLDQKSRFNQKQLISYIKRDKLKRFNTINYHWVFYDVVNGFLYDQYCLLITTNGKEFLQANGMITRCNRIIKLDNFN